MKHTLGCLLAVLPVFIINTAVAQVAPGNFKVSRYKTVQNYSNSYVPPFSIGSRHRLNNINLDAIRDFLGRYTEEAHDATWQVSGKGDFIARFSVDSIDVIAAYGKGGNWLYSVRRYSASHLQDDIKSLIKNQYADYSIAHVDEVSLPIEKNTIYIVSIQNDVEVKILNICDGNIEVRQRFAK